MCLKLQPLTNYLNIRDKRGFRQKKDAHRRQYRYRIILLRFRAVAKGGSDPPPLHAARLRIGTAHLLSGTAEKHYPAMSMDDLCALAMAELAAPDCTPFLWAAFPQFPEALRLIKARGRPRRQATNVHPFIVSPVQAHCKKPDKAREKIMALPGDVPRMELFARQATPD